MSDLFNVDDLDVVSPVYKNCNSGKKLKKSKKERKAKRKERKTEGGREVKTY